MSGSFCTHEQVLKALEQLAAVYETVIPIASEASAFTDTRFGTSEELLERLLTMLAEEGEDAVFSYIRSDVLKNRRKKE